MDKTTRFPFSKGNKPTLFRLPYAICPMLFALCLSVFTSTAIATIRYVSHNSTPTPPYTTWETAADSIQKCINYCVAGDTIIVANGTYYESLVVDKYLSLIGSSMDSTIIDGTGLANTTVDFQTDGSIKYFTIKGKGEGTTNTLCMGTSLNNIIIKFCKIKNALNGLGFTCSSSVVEQCFITNVMQGYVTSCYIDTYYPIIKNSLIFINSTFPYPTGIMIDGGNNISSNNIICGNSNSYRGIQSGLFLDVTNNIVTNNIVSGFERNIDGFADDTAIVENNISLNAGEIGYTINSKTDMRNNISAYNATGVVGPTSTNSDYNLYWQNGTNATDSLASHDIIANPMFVNDTIPVYGGTYDFHLQAYSPAIDRGDPDILDVDGTRSDIGVFGGPLGEEYTYQDLAPRPPVNLTAVLDSNQILLSWNRNTEADFSHYNLYRDTTEGFIIDSTKLISTQTDTFYIQTVPGEEINLYYKLTAVDSQGNESGPSEEVHVFLTGINNKKQKTINNYKLYQNYPNPFNPETRIGYRLKERGYVKLMVYDIKGELVEVLVNKVQEAGYHEVNFKDKRQKPVGDEVSPLGGEKVKSALASGIYLYRIEVIGEGNIPRFSDMKKMILLK
jgi:hypothetical protein